MEKRKAWRVRDKKKLYLVDSLGVTKRPSTSSIRLLDSITVVAASALGNDSTIARATIASMVLFDHLAEFILEV